MFLTGVQPTGKLHLGNYFGAIKPALEQTQDGFIFIADYHALTSNISGAELHNNTLETARTLMALGCKVGSLFKQSDVPQVTELMWLLLNHISVAELERAVSYKDKKDKHPHTGLLTYPVLMAADILAYQTTHVPVGPDQHQHLQFTQLIAERFNRTYGEVFTIPKAIVCETQVPGIDGIKMSKSKNNYIPIFGSESEIKERVFKIVTDSASYSEPKDPYPRIPFQLNKLVASEADSTYMGLQYLKGNYGDGHAKSQLYQELRKYFYNQQEVYDSLLDKPLLINNFLASGAALARPIAKNTLNNARKACGLS